MYIFAISLTFCLSPLFAVLSLVKTGFLGDITFPSSVLAAFIVINIVVLNVLVLSRLPSVGLVKRASVHPQRLMKCSMLVLHLATRLRLMATSALMALFLAVDDSDKTASSNAHVQIVPGGFFPGESSIASVSWIVLVALACRVIVGFDVVASALLVSSMRTILTDSKDIPKSSSSVGEDNEAHDDASSLAEDHEMADETANDDDEWSSEDDDDDLTVFNDEDEMSDDDDDDAVTVVDDMDTISDRSSALLQSLRRQLLRLQLAHVLRDSGRRCPHTLASRRVMDEFSPPRDVGDMEAFLAQSRATYRPLSSVAPAPPAPAPAPPATGPIPSASASTPPAAGPALPAAGQLGPASAQPMALVVLIPPALGHVGLPAPEEDEPGSSSPPTTAASPNHLATGCSTIVSSDSMTPSSDISHPSPPIA